MKIIRSKYNLIKYFYYKFILRKFLKKNINNKNYYYLISGGVADIYHILSICGALKKKFDPVFIISEQYIYILKLFPEINKYFCINHKIYSKLNLYLYYQDEIIKYKNKKGQIKSLHVANYRELSILINNYSLDYFKSFNLMFKNYKIKFNKISPYFSQENIDYVVNDLDKLKSEKKIAIINPICYTHENLDISLWKEIYKIIESYNYDVYFNIKANFEKDINFEFDNSFNQIEIPADLLPIYSSKVDLVISRYGGGFDLLYVYSNNSCPILITLRNTLGKKAKKDVPIILFEKFWLEFCGKIPSQLILDNKYDLKSINKITNLIK